MKTSTRVHRNGGSKAATAQVPNNADARTGEEPSAAQIIAQLRKEPHKNLETLAQGYWDDPAARPVFNEWLASVPHGVLINLAYFLCKLTPTKPAALKGGAR